MKILHTSDWHVGKVLKGRDRHDEHVAVLRQHRRRRRATRTWTWCWSRATCSRPRRPTPKAQGLVMRTLLALREDGRQVVAIAGNHDNQGLLDAVYRPVLGELGLHVLGTPKRPGQGGSMALRTRGGEAVNVAALPFLSHRLRGPRRRSAAPRVRRAHPRLRPAGRRHGAAAHRGLHRPTRSTWSWRTRRCSAGAAAAANATCRPASDYELPASMFPASRALRRARAPAPAARRSPGPARSFYSGSPLAIDFGEEANDPVALIVTAEPGIRADAGRCRSPAAARCGRCAAPWIR